VSYTPFVRRFLCSVSLTLVAAACAPPEVKIGKVNLVDADGVEPAAEGTIVEVPGPIPKSLSGPVRIAIDGDVTYADAVKAIAAVKAAGGTPVLLVLDRNRVVALPPLSGKKSDTAIRLKARTDADGCKEGQALCVQACISPPDNDTATCVRRPDGKHVDRAFVRQVLAKAIREWAPLSDIHVWIDPKLSWADAVRAIDGARTCCGEGKVTVSVEPAP
jgi:hypothetical protein